MEHGPLLQAQDQPSSQEGHPAAGRGCLLARLRALLQKQASKLRVDSPSQVHTGFPYVHVTCLVFIFILFLFFFFFIFKFRFHFISSCLHYLMITFIVGSCHMYITLLNDYMRK